MSFIQCLCEDPGVAEQVWRIIEVLAPFAILAITLHDERKQNAKYKKREVKMQYLSECMKWLSELKMMAYIVSRKGTECLCTYDTREFGKRYGEFNAEANLMMEKCLVGISTYGNIAKSLGIKKNLEEVKGLTGDFIRDVRRGIKKCPSGRDKETVESIDDSTAIYEKKLENMIAAVGKVFAQLLEEK